MTEYKLVDSQHFIIFKVPLKNHNTKIFLLNSQIFTVNFQCFKKLGFVSASASSTSNLKLDNYCIFFNFL